MIFSLEIKKYNMSFNVIPTNSVVVYDSITGVNNAGIVIFSKSDPKVFGYEQNINLLKDKKYLRSKQFDIWEAEEFDKDSFVTPDVILEHIK